MNKGPRVADLNVSCAQAGHAGRGPVATARGKQAEEAAGPLPRDLPCGLQPRMPALLSKRYWEHGLLGVCFFQEMGLATLSTLDLNSGAQASPPQPPEWLVLQACATALSIADI